MAPIPNSSSHFHLHIHISLGGINWALGLAHELSPSICHPMGDSSIMKARLFLLFPNSHTLTKNYRPWKPWNKRAQCPQKARSLLWKCLLWFWLPRRSLTTLQCFSTNFLLGLPFQILFLIISCVFLYSLSLVTNNKCVPSLTRTRRGTVGCLRIKPRLRRSWRGEESGWEDRGAIVQAMLVQL